MAEILRERMKSAWLLHQQGNLVKAEQQYLAILAEFPTNADALHFLGVLHAQKGALADAVELIGRAVALEPGNANAHYNLGNVLRGLNRRDEALVAYDHTVAAMPTHAGAWTNRGAILQELRRPQEALASFDFALRLEPNHLTALYNRGNVLRDLGQPEEALASYRRALALAPDYAPAWDASGAVLQDRSRFDEAFAAYDKAYGLNARLPYVEGWRLHAKMHLCDWSNLLVEIASLERNVQAGALAAAPFVLLACGSSASAQLICSQRYAEDKYPEEPAVWRGEAYARDRIRIGYVSGEFRAQATAYLTVDLFETHDRSAFETHGFAIGPDDGSPMRTRLEQAFDTFHDVSNWANAEIARLIRELKIDVLVNLNGYFGSERTGIFAFRPAPVQVNYLGFPGTMGAPYIDYIIADATIIPGGEQQHFSEKVVYLPETYQCNDRKRRIGEKTFTRSECGLPEQGFVFCCFNGSHKITPDVFDIWMRILRAVEGSVLWLIESNPLVPRNLSGEAERRGVAESRLVFAPVMKLEDHLARLKLADLVLDTLPHNAHTTASDALWSGVPVLTRTGSTFAGRVAASLLHAIGLPELITHSAVDYEALAIKLARENTLMAGLKAKLAANRSISPLFNTPRFARHLEAAYKTMCERQRQGLTPASFAVKALVA